MGFSSLRTTLIHAIRCSAARHMSFGLVSPPAPLPVQHRLSRAYLPSDACSFIASHYPNACLLIMILCIIPFLAGVLGLWLIAESNPYGGLACL
jgi:hypothetical protein